MAGIPSVPPPPYAPGPAVHAFAITPGSTVFPVPTRFVWVGGAGNLEVLMTGDTVPVTLTGVLAGTMLEISVTQVLAASTTATTITGLY